MTKFEVMLGQVEQIVKDTQRALEVRQRLLAGDLASVNVAIQVRHTDVQLDAPVSELSSETAAHLADMGVTWANKRILSRLDELAECIAGLFDTFGDGRVHPVSVPEPAAGWCEGSPPDGPTE